MVKISPLSSQPQLAYINMNHPDFHGAADVLQAITKYSNGNSLVRDEESVIRACLNCLPLLSQKTNGIPFDAISLSHLHDGKFKRFISHVTLGEILSSPGDRNPSPSLVSKPTVPNGQPKIVRGLFLMWKCDPVLLISFP